MNNFKGISNRIDQVVKGANLKIENKEKQIAELRRERSLQEKKNIMMVQELVHEVDSIKELYLNSIDSLLVERESRKAINSKIEILEDIINLPVKPVLFRNGI